MKKIIGKLYSYTISGAVAAGKIVNFTDRAVEIDNGDIVKTDEFDEFAERLDDSSDEITDENETENLYNQSEIGDIQILFDDNGFPYLPTEEQTTNTKTDRQQEKPKQKTEKIHTSNDPVSILVNNATLSKARINLQIEIDVIPISLFNTINESFDGSDTTLEILTEKIDKDALNKAIKLAIMRQVYGNQKAIG